MVFRTRALFLVAMALLVVPLVNGSAHAAAAEGDGDTSVAALRAQADAIANRYFDALTRYKGLGREVDANRQQIASLAARARTARQEARQRAVSAYQTSGARLASVIDSDDAMAAARRMRFIDRITERDQEVYTKLRSATEDLNASRRALEADLQRQADALAELKDQGRTMDAKLARAQQQEEAAAANAAHLAAAAAAAAPQPLPAAQSAPGAAAAVPAAAPAAAPAPPPAPAPAPAPPPPKPAAPPKPVAPSPPPYQGTGGVNPHHSDPFLTCVRARESGGNYGAVNPAGPYLGAYQFLQSTWNASANHAGRPELIGVPANLASPYDQDDVAWALYQWQGSGPWGGSC
jgi:peptidoglycan hydrolase CwlO-like protein